METVERLIASLGGITGRRLTSVPGVVAEVPADRLGVLAANPAVKAVNDDRPMRGSLDRTATTIGARWVAENLGVDGAGIGVAIIDSGIAHGHIDLSGRIAHFADFVGQRSQPHDGYGHGMQWPGSSPAGCVFGRGTAGIAPGAHLIVLKTLDSAGNGFISNAIAALDYAIEHRATFNIRVVNLSVAAGCTLPTRRTR